MQNRNKLRFRNFTGGSLIKNLPANAGDVGSIPWGRKWQPTPVFLPGESHGQGSLAGYSPWGLESQTGLSNYTDWKIIKY